MHHRRPPVTAGPSDPTSDRGQAFPLMAAVLVLVAVVLLALVPLARGAVERTAAQSAADAAALAGAAEGEAAARDVAAANRAVVVEYRAFGTDVWVTVALGDARAEARARRSPG